MMLIYVTCIIFALCSSAVKAAALDRRAESGEALMLYGYNPPRVNPEYCVGFRITYPTYPGQVYEVNSLQQLSWEVDNDIPYSPDVITRIRVLNSTQHNEFVIGENISLYTKENTGETTFRLGIEDITGLYHYRVMVNYPGTNVHCVYESVPFMILQSPFKKHITAGPLQKQLPVDNVLSSPVPRNQTAQTH